MEEEQPEQTLQNDNTTQNDVYLDQDSLIDKTQQRMIQTNLNKYIDQNMEDINEMRNQMYKHKDRELKRFQEFKKILEQSVKQFLQDLKKSYEQHFKEKQLSLNQIVQDLKEKLQPYASTMDLSYSQKQIIEDTYKEQFDSIAKIKQFIQFQMPVFSIKTEYLSEIKEKIIHFLNMKFPTTKSWPKFDRPGQSDITVPYFCPEKMKVALYDPKNNKFDFKSYAENMLNEELPVYCQPIYHQEGSIKKLFLIGGLQYNEEQNHHIPTYKNYVIDLNTGQVQRIADSPQSKSKQCLVKIQKEIYSIGGIITQNRIRCQTCEKYDITNDKWIGLPSMINLRVMAQGCFIQNKNSKRLYIFGGITDEKRVQKSIEYFDLNKNEWFLENVSNKNFYIGKHSGYAINIGLTDILLVGGYSFCQAYRSKNVQLYNIVNNQITDFGDILPIGVAKDGRGGDVLYMKNSIYILNSIQSQIFENIEQRISEILVYKINNQFSCITNVINIDQNEQILELKETLNNQNQQPNQVFQQQQQQQQQQMQIQ